MLNIIIFNQQMLIIHKKFPYSILYTHRGIFMFLSNLLSYISVIYTFVFVFLHVCVWKRKCIWTNHFLLPGNGNLYPTWERWIGINNANTWSMKRDKANDKGRQGSVSSELSTTPSWRWWGKDSMTQQHLSKGLKGIRSIVKGKCKGSEARSQLQ